MPFFAPSVTTESDALFSFLEQQCIIRESIDGAIAYQLNAQADGQPWPPAEWS